MITSERTCSCGTPIPNDTPHHVCPSCAAQVWDDLARLPALVDDVNLTVTRQTATGDRNGPRAGAADVVAWNDRASKVLAAATATLLTWARSCVPAMEAERDVLLDRRTTFTTEARSASDPDQRAHATYQATKLNHPIATLTDQLAYLTGPRWVVAASQRTLATILTTRFDELLAREEAPAFVTSLHRVCADLLAATDLPAARLYLGPCLATPIPDKPVPCSEEIYAVDHTDQGKDHVCDRCRTTRCPTCGTEHNVTQRRTWLKEALDDRLATAGDIARGLATTTGVTVTKDQINGWRTRGRLLTHGSDKHGSALYRVGDVIDLATQDTRDTRRKASG